MVEFAWSENMSVGVAALDADHRGLMRMISLLEDAYGQDACQVADMALDGLVAYCNYHFAREEQVMARCGFPALKFHSGEHRRFTRFVSGLRERCSQADAQVIEELRDYLTRWLFHHILIQDMAYKPYILAAADADRLPDLPMAPGDQDDCKRARLPP